MNALVEQVAKARQGLAEILSDEGFRQVEYGVIAGAADNRFHIGGFDRLPVSRVGDQQIEGFGGIPQAEAGFLPQDNPGLRAERLAPPGESSREGSPS